MTGFWDALASQAAYLTWYGWLGLVIGLGSLVALIVTVPALAKEAMDERTTWPEERQKQNERVSRGIEGMRYGRHLDDADTGAILRPHIPRRGAPQPSTGPTQHSEGERNDAQR